VICPYKEEREARALELEYEELEADEKILGAENESGGNDE
jgi:hypothetical protein